MNPINNKNHPMITDHVSIEIVDSFEAAPRYTQEEFPLWRIERVLIIENGADSGNPTVDIQLVDKDGKKAVIMATAGITAMIGEMVRAKMVPEHGRG